MTLQTAEFIYRRWWWKKNVYGALVESYWQGTIEVLAVKPVPVPLRSPQILHGLTLNLRGEKVTSNSLTDDSTLSSTVPF